jgi:transcriptional regulator of arginine metabolism
MGDGPVVSNGMGVKEGRQRRIIRLLEERPVASQNELAKLLRAAGYRATQATVSRDLEELGVVKIRREGRVAYALASPQAAVRTDDVLGRALAGSVRAVETSANIVVVHTPPGHAQMVAGALDHAGLGGVAGTVAGDDTILVVARESVPATDVERRIRALAGMPPPLPPGRRVRADEREVNAER